MSHSRVPPTKLAAILMALLAATTLALAQAGKLNNPQDGDTLRGIVPLSATKPGAPEGWVSYMLSGGQLQKPLLIAAVIHPFSYNWNTRERQEGKPRFPDGQYTLIMTAHDPTSRVLDTEQVAVTIQNSVTGPDAQNGVQLHYEFRRGESDEYIMTGEAELSLKAAEQAYQAAVAPLAGVAKLNFTRTIMGYSELDGGIVRNAPTDGVLEMEGANPRLFPNLGKLFTIYQATNGVTKATKKDDPRFGLGELYVALPSRTLRIGDKWQSEMAFMPEFTKAKRQIVNGTHTLEALEWMHKEKCARIKSTYSYKGKVTLRPGAFDVEADTDMKGTQTMWFAYESGKVLHVEEENRHDITIDVSKLGGAALAGGGAMMGPGMGMTGMPGAGMPGMEMMGMPGAGGTMMPAGEGMAAGAAMPGMSAPMGSVAPAGSMMPGMAGTEGAMGSGMYGGAYGGAAPQKKEIEAQYRVRIVLDTGRQPGEIVAEASHRSRVHVEAAPPPPATKPGARRGARAGTRGKRAAPGGNRVAPRVRVPRR